MHGMSSVQDAPSSGLQRVFETAGRQASHAFSGFRVPATMQALPMTHQPSCTVQEQTPAAHESAVHASPSLHDLGMPTQSPATHVSPSVQESPSQQGPVTSVHSDKEVAGWHCRQPDPGDGSPWK